MAPSEFWGLSLAEFVAIYEINYASRRVGNVSQAQVDRMLEMQDRIDKGLNPWQ